MPSPPIRPYVLSPHNASLRVEGGKIVYPAGVPPRQKVCIVGGSRRALRISETYEHCFRLPDVPFDSDEWLIFGLNNFWNVMRDSEDRLRADVWWEQHQITPDAEGPHAGEPIQDAQDLEWLRTCPVPIYTTEPFPANPNAVVWPIAQYAEAFRDYFTCTFAMQVLNAYVAGAQEIRLCGVELQRGTQREATVEAACLNYWLGFVEGKGVKVTWPEGGWVLWHPYRYGHDYWRESDWTRAYVRELRNAPVAI